MLKPILVAVEGSDLDRTALAHALRLAAHGEELILVRVIEIGLDLRDSYAVTECTEEEALQALRELGQTAGRELTYQVRYGRPEQEIVAAATAAQAQLIVLVTHGRTGLVRWFEGSVAERVARESPCPVWLARGSHPAEPVRKALVPLDWSREAEEALPYARQHLAEGGELILATALHLLPDPPEGESLEHYARRYLDELVERLRQVGVRAASVLAEGPVAGALVHSATQEGANLVVIASHGRSGPSRWLLGSVAEELVRDSPCPILVLGPQARRG